MSSSTWYRKLANVHCQRPLVLTEIISTSAVWALHTLIESSKQCTINKFLSLVHPFSCVSPTFLPTIIHPPTALINHSRGKIYIHSIKMYHKYHTSIDIPALHVYRKGGPKPTQECPTKHGFVMSNKFEQNSDSITPLFSNCAPDNGATENNKVTTPKFCSHSWLITNLCFVGHSEVVQKRDNSGPSHLTCITHARHVSPKWVMHMFCYSTYAFYKILHMKREGQSLYLPY
jgi:hypothetical protein